jgi:hypothetical protein
MSNSYLTYKGALAAVLTAGISLATGAVQAREVVWSIGVGAPGVQVGVTNAPPMVVQTQPVYWQRPAVVVQPPPAYYQAPQPVYYAAPQLVYYGRPQAIAAPQPYYYRGWGPRHHGHWDRDRQGFGPERDHR